MEPQGFDIKPVKIGTVCSIMHCYKPAANEENSPWVPLCDEHLAAAEKRDWEPGN
jgi:hypothetical protein